MDQNKCICKRLLYSAMINCLIGQILDDTFASQMQRLRGNALQEKDLETPRSVIEARSILSKDTKNVSDYV